MSSSYAKKEFNTKISLLACGFVEIAMKKTLNLDLEDDLFKPNLFLESPSLVQFRFHTKFTSLSHQDSRSAILLIVRMAGRPSEHY